MVPARLDGTSLLNSGQRRTEVGLELECQGAVAQHVVQLVMVEALAQHVQDAVHRLLGVKIRRVPSSSKRPFNSERVRLHRARGTEMSNVISSHLQYQRQRQQSCTWGGCSAAVFVASGRFRTTGFPRASAYSQCRSATAVQSYEHNIYSSCCMWPAVSVTHLVGLGFGLSSLCK